MTTARTPRLHSLDLLRGMAVAAMIVVNNPGNWNAVYRQLSHSPWNGATFADLIFPAFIFILGVSLALSEQSTPDVAHERGGVDRRTVSRAATLIGLGLALNAVKAWPHLDALRVPGVLQRIGATYLIAMVILRFTRGRRLWLWALTLSVLHWLILTPRPWSPGVLLSPETSNAVAIDRWLFGSHILAASGDPEGALGVLTSVATALFGASAGVWLSRQRPSGQSQVPTSPLLHLQLTLVGTCLLVAGYAWSLMLPLNKFLWTGSFAVFTSGAATLGLAACLLWTNVPGTRLLGPFEWLGTNPLAIYFLSEFVGSLLDRPWLTWNGHATAPKDVLFWSGLVPVTGDRGGAWSSAVYALLYTAFWIGVAGLMRWRGVRIRA